MGGAQLVCDLAPLERVQWTKAGPQAVEFLFRPGAGMQERPLARIASGGEVSRVMLAVKVVLGEVDDVDTLVFDEVDAGVGGSTAVALADVLADLARTHQVIVVTHRWPSEARRTTWCARLRGTRGPCPKPTCGSCPKASVPPKSRACCRAMLPRHRLRTRARCWPERPDSPSGRLVFLAFRAVRC